MNYSYINNNNNYYNYEINCVKQQNGYYKCQKNQNFECILDPNYSKDIWFNIKNDYLVKTEYLGNKMYRESYIYNNDLNYIINHNKTK
jgi:hypothetical protein